MSHYQALLWLPHTILPYPTMAWEPWEFQHWPNTSQLWKDALETISDGEPAFYGMLFLVEMATEGRDK